MITSTDSALVASSDSPTGLDRALAAIGRERPVMSDELMAAPLVLRHRDVSAALRDTATFRNRFYGVGPVEHALISLDGEEHAAKRRMFSQFFSPAASWRPSPGGQLSWPRSTTTAPPRSDIHSGRCACPPPGRMPAGEGGDVGPLPTFTDVRYAG